VSDDLATAPELTPLWEDLGLRVSGSERPPGSLALESSLGGGAVLERAARELLGGGALLLRLPPGSSDGLLARWRNDLWPLLHVVAIYELGVTVVRRTLQGKQSLPGRGGSGTVLALRRAAHVLSPAATREKFDANASGWNGEPGGPGYPHFRWMRKYVGTFAPSRDGQRILDFGSGAGWVGIEAARGRTGVALCAFDPSPELVRITGENARAEGIADFTGRVGFGEAPPFPAAGERPFELVISSGVVSFSPDFETWMRGLVSCCAPGGTLVIGDLNPTSRGMATRRAERPLVPIRELNGRRADEVRGWLEARGFRHRRTAGYQATWPMPQLMHWNETRLNGLLSRPLVALNAGASALDGLLGGPRLEHFDSWVMHFDVPQELPGR
jgi:SAM-dependent methyltransferase